MSFPTFRCGQRYERAMMRLWVYNSEEMAHWNGVRIQESRSERPGEALAGREPDESVRDRQRNI
jgi:hypothetical protein